MNANPVGPKVTVAHQPMSTEEKARAKESIFAYIQKKIEVRDMEREHKSLAERIKSAKNESPKYHTPSHLRVIPEEKTP